MELTNKEKALIAWDRLMNKSDAKGITINEKSMWIAGYESALNSI